MTLFSVDILSLVSDAIANPSTYGFNNVTEPCFDQTTLTLCANPDEYLFWDRIHPSTRAHQAVAELAFKTADKQTNVPEPSGAIALLALAGLAWGKGLRKKSSL